VITSAIANKPKSRSDSPSGTGPRIAHFGTNRTGKHSDWALTNVPPERGKPSNGFRREVPAMTTTFPGRRAPLRRYRLRADPAFRAQRRREYARRFESGEPPQTVAKICPVCSTLFVRRSRSKFCGNVCYRIRMAVVLRAARKSWLRTPKGKAHKTAANRRYSKTENGRRHARIHKRGQRARRRARLRVERAARVHR
jgi:hypothetical protein